MTAQEYQQRAQQHRPDDQAALVVEIRRLTGEGLKPRDIAAALNLHISFVLLALRA